MRDYVTYALGEVHATKPVHVCFSFKVGNTPHKAAMRSMELMIGEVKPKVDKALGPWKEPSTRASGP